MIFTHLTNITLDECKKRISMNINSKNLISNPNKIQGRIIGNYFYLYKRFFTFEKNPLKPIFYGHFSQKNGSIAVKGISLINPFGIIIAIPLFVVIFIRIEIQPYIINAILIRSLLLFIIFVMWYLFDKQKNEIQQFILLSLENTDATYDRLEKFNKPFKNVYINFIFWSLKIILITIIISIIVNLSIMIVSER